jgi:hypothetical protein
MAFIPLKLGLMRQTTVVRGISSDQQEIFKWETRHWSSSVITIPLKQFTNKTVNLVWKYRNGYRIVGFKASMCQIKGGYWKPFTKYQNCYHMWWSVNMIYKMFDNISIAEIAWYQIRWEDEYVWPRLFSLWNMIHHNCKTKEKKTNLFLSRMLEDELTMNSYFSLGLLIFFIDRTTWMNEWMAYRKSNRLAQKWLWPFESTIHWYKISSSSRFYGWE